MKRFFPALLVAILCAPAALMAYPGTPDTWTWKYHEDAYYVPMQLSATTDEDGRLRTLFLDDSQPVYFNDGTTSHRVAPPFMQSFRAFPDGAILNEYRGLTVDDYTNVANRGTLPSYSAALRARRTGIYSVKGDETNFAIGAAYARLTESQSIVGARSIYHPNQFIGTARRPVVDNKTHETSDNEVLDIASISTPQGLDVIPNQARLEVQSVTSGSPALILSYKQTNPSGTTSVFLRVLEAGTPAGWATNRIFTGGSLIMTSDRRDFYAFVTSYKYTSSGGPFTTEARLFRVRTGGNIDPIINIASITSYVAESLTLLPGTTVMSSLVYPEIVMPNTNEPEWIAWGNPDTNRIHLKKHVMGTGGTSEENARTIASGYNGAFGVSDGDIASGVAPSLSLDRLGILHFAYRSGNTAIYGRENTGGQNYTSIVLAGVCSGAPAVSAGPGQYPYVVYPGRKVGSPNTVDKLVVAYPTGLEAAYNGDNEDRDNDGRIGLVERMQGTSDTVPNNGPPTGIGTVNVIPQIVTTPSGRFFEMSIRLASGATRQGTDSVWHLADGVDTLVISPAYTGDLKSFSTFGFSVMDEFAAGGARYVTVRFQTALGSNFSTPASLFSFKVRRVLGPP